mgnify:CR=1 FL=1
MSSSPSLATLVSEENRPMKMGMVASVGRQPARGLTPACSYSTDVSFWILSLSSPKRSLIRSMRGFSACTAMALSTCRERAGGAVDRERGSRRVAGGHLAIGPG